MATLAPLIDAVSQPSPVLEERVLEETGLEEITTAQERQPVAVVRQPLLRVENLRIELNSGADVVTDISFDLAPGEILGLVGESGSGKTSIASALLGHSRNGARITHGRVLIGDIDILALSADELRRVRGPLVTHVAQDPAMSLNPLLRIGRHLDEILAAHHPELSRAERETRMLEVLRDVSLPDTKEFLRRFPHQLSGGQQQRVQLALAFVLRPRLIVLDEPTTALDVITQEKVLATIRTLCRQYGVAAVYVSHDLGVIRNLADQVVVLYAGRIAEAGPLQRLFAKPSHPYSQGLFAAIIDVAVRRPLQPIPGQAPAPGTRPAGCAFNTRCPIATDACTQSEPNVVSLSPQHRVSCFNLNAGPAFSVGNQIDRPPRPQDTTPLLRVDALNAWYGARQVLFDIELSVAAGECVALVGESGSGKTTLARALAGLGDSVGSQASGKVLYSEKDLPLRARERESSLRHQIQYIFQNPYRALNPRHTVGDTLSSALNHFFKVSAAESRQRIEAALARVSLQPDTVHAYPRELSGGERQRVAIARALVCEPRLLICDEITSALDVSVQATILALLRDLQNQGLAILFVTHDLGVVRAVADKVAVLYQGQIVEQGLVDHVLDTPHMPYTESLVVNSPSLVDRSEKNALRARARHPRFAF